MLAQHLYAEYFARELAMKKVIQCITQRAVLPKCSAKGFNRDSQSHRENFQKMIIGCQYDIRVNMSSSF